MRHDLFISYSRDDEGWAAKLEASLSARGLNVYRDRTRLNAGDEWEPQLRDAVVESRGMVVLWSGKAATSKWVSREQEAFRQMMHLDTTHGRASVRRIVQVSLEGGSPEYPTFQTINEVHDSGAYAAGAGAVDPNLWASVTDRVERGVRVRADLPVVHQVILASTRSGMQAVADDRRAVEDAAPYADLIKSLNIPSRAQLVGRYGDEPSEWRPFDGARTILTLMSELREQLVSRGAAPFLWQPTAEVMWSGVDNKRELRDLLLRQPCVIVLDALSLYDPTVWHRYDLLLPCLNNPRAAIVVLPPYSNRERHHLRSVLEAAAAKMFEPFYRPDRAQPQIAASCSLLADDQYEMSRVVAAMIRTAFKKPKSQYTRIG